MPIRLQTNQYRGLNAHLNSILQVRNDWSMFHGSHITHLREALQARFSPDSGYFAVTEKSLQIARDDLITGNITTRTMIPNLDFVRSSSIT
jgi:hypothetical protein